ncbi:MAG: hypothetical protein GC153_11850 [Alphaproteobacteria bacterium]|nr:hypothetical protein [Alphaproteobacteria bacterium]
MSVFLAAALMAQVSVARPFIAKPGFEWVNGKVTSITAQLPQHTYAVVDNKPVRFCDPQSGVDYVVMTNNVQYDLLKSALETGHGVQVGVRDFGVDPADSIRKLCIDRVIY